MRIAVIDRDKCRPEKCGLLCARVCPVNKSGLDPAIKVENDRPIIVEELCIGCGICVKKCPFGAITIVNVPEEEGEIVHQYGPNSFRLLGLPYPKRDGVVGIVGRNGVGKSTAIKILSGIIVPNLGKWENPPSKEEVIRRFRGTELQSYFIELYESKLKVVHKIQEIEEIPKVVGERRVGELVGEHALESVGIAHLKDRLVKQLSGGELQLLAIAAAIEKDADVLIFDEPSSFLDVSQRLRIARLIRNKSKGKLVIVVEHDLAVLDYLSDYIFVVYGHPGVFGKFSQIKGVREGINQFLEGFLREENVRIREYAIIFESSPAELEKKKPYLVYQGFTVRLGDFTLKAEGGDVHEGEIVGILGPNGIGKTTFVRVLAGEVEPEEGGPGWELNLSYKPQYITLPPLPVRELFEGTNEEILENELKGPLELDSLWERDASTLSGGERQRVAIALCLARDADLYLLDEPSAFLDAEQRVRAAKVIKRVIMARKKAAFVVDHDLIFIDYLADRIIVFSGKPGREGFATPPLTKRDGMNKFLKALDITFRRDARTGRPRVNKPGSQKDVEQKKKGEYFYG